MILKFILIAVILISIYKFMGGSLRLSSQEDQQKENDTDALEECRTCGTYVTRKESIVFKGKYYCSKECLPK